MFKPSRILSAMSPPMGTSAGSASAVAVTPAADLDGRLAFPMTPAPGLQLRLEYERDAVDEANVDVASPGLSPAFR